MGRNGSKMFNMFRKLPLDLYDRGSLRGVFSSLVCVVCIVYLIGSEFALYSRPQMKSTVVMDSHQEDLLRVNFNVTLPNVPCAEVTLDVTDHMGQTFTNVRQHLRKLTLRTQKQPPFHTRKSKYTPPPSTANVAVEREIHTDEQVQLSTQLTTQEEFDTFMSKYELVMVNYYAPWCPYCQDLAPTWERVANALKTHPQFAEKVALAKIDCTQPEAIKLCRRARIRAFPSILIYVYGQGFTRFMYGGPRSEPHLIRFLELFYTRVNPDTQEDISHLPDTLHEAHLTVDDHPDHKTNEDDRFNPKDAYEGCEIAGSLSVQRVPGKFLIYPHSNHSSFDYSQINMSHTINHLSFGQEFHEKKTKGLQDHFDLIQKILHLSIFQNRVNSFDNTVFLAENNNITIEHYLKIVGFDYFNTKERGPIGRQRRVYDYMGSSNQYNATGRMPAALFTFDISPLTVEIRQFQKPFYQFLTSLCAIIGGVYTILGLIDSGIFHTMNSIEKKRQLGKLN